MAGLSPQEIRGMNLQDRASRLYELRQELVHERGVAAMGGSPPSPGKIRQIRRQIARLLTIANEERHGIRGAKPAPGAPKKAAPAKKAAPTKAAPKPASKKSEASKAKAAKPAAASKAKPKEATRRNE